MEVRYDPQISEGWVHKDRYFHSLVNSRDGLVGHVIRRDCPQENGGWTLANGFQPAQVQCNNCGRVGHPRERCFDLYLELKSGRGGGCGGAA